jgi:altronate hydrolase
MTTTHYELKQKAIILKPEADDVAVLMEALPAGTVLEYERKAIRLRQDTPQGHKIALKAIKKDDAVKKYGQIIGYATTDIEVGDHVHVHNMGVKYLTKQYEYATNAKPVDYYSESEMRYFMGFKREDGRVGTRNYIALISSVNCSSYTTKAIAHKFKDISRDYPNVDGVIALTHQGGCGSTLNGEGYHTFQRALANFAKHPNVAAYVIIGLGCEVNQPLALIENQGLIQIGVNGENVLPKVLSIQDEGGIQKTIDAGVQAVLELLPKANAYKRTKQPVSEIMLGTKCGGSDANSGMTANPALGIALDEIVRYGGTGILAETPEMYGAEHLLMKRARSVEVAKKLEERIHWWEEYTTKWGGEINNNPAPGNIRGGLTTIFEKSLGAIAKGGSTPVNAVYLYGEKITEKGFVLMDTPGYDPVTVTGMVAGGANVVVFTTGRGSVFGYKPTPSIKVATHSALYHHMKDDMDINAGLVHEGLSIREVGLMILEEIISVASGKKTKSELQDVGEDEFCPWIYGPML